MENKEINSIEQKKLLVDLLIEFDSFCRINQINYYLFAGTLLGAVRHKGFIPWDDDIDVCMFREDYEKLIKTYNSVNNRYSLRYFNKNEKSFYYPFAKLIDNSTILIEGEDKKQPIGLYLDIFPLDYCGNTKFECQKLIDSIYRYNGLRQTKYMKISKENCFKKNVLICFGKIISLFISRGFIINKIIKKSKYYYGSKTKYVGELCCNAYGIKEVFDEKMLEESTDLVFEGYKFKAPLNYDYVLRTMYGNYMQLPPQEKQITHHDFKCWYK